mmetsp:Transcript_30915/g.60868  ORF Transcript_30915/g.60868 Transcript_30915/m.60868 type:complete len:141 (+) Transcript_30915:1152-1574(+)
MCINLYAKSAVERNCEPPQMVDRHRVKLTVREYLTKREEVKQIRGKRKSMNGTCKSHESDERPKGRSGERFFHLPHTDGSSVRSSPFFALPSPSLSFVSGCECSRTHPAFPHHGQAKTVGTMQLLSQTKKNEERKHKTNI